MNSNFILERMTRKHINDLVEIEKLSFSKPWSYSAFEAELSNDTAVFFSAVEEGRAVGYIGFHTVIDEAYIANIAVLPDFRRRGTASALLELAIDYCRKNKMSFITLEVRKSNFSAVSLYQRFGFKTVGERKNFYTLPSEDAYIMTLYLNHDTDIEVKK